MNKFEKRLLLLIDENLPFCFAAVMTALGVAVRYFLFDFVSGDASYFLLPWYDEIARNGLYVQVGNYNLTYQIVIWFMTKLPIEPLYALKIFSCTFDFLLAVSLAWLAKCSIDSAPVSMGKQTKKWIMVLVYAVVVLCPTIFMNSAMWAQCDAVFSTFIILSLCFLAKDKYNQSFVLLGIAFSFKLHAVFILPLYLFAWYRKRSFSIVRFAFVPLAMLVMNLPAVFWGRSLLESFGIYVNQTSTYEMMSMNYPSIWNLLCDVFSAEHYRLLKPVGIILAVSIVALLLVWWIRMGYEVKGVNLLIMAFLSSYTCILFLPSMHERYGYIYEILSILLAVIIPKTIPLCASLLVMSCGTYCAYFFAFPADLTLYTYINIAVWLAYIFVFSKVLCKER